jgi:hypothetical protein
MKQLFAFFLAFCITNVALTQSATSVNDSVCHWERKKVGDKFIVWPQFTIREAFEDITEKQKPAKLSLTWPKDSTRQFMVNAGIAISLNRICNKYAENLSRLSPSAFFVYNRNTLIKKLQNQLKIGAGLEYQWGNTHIGTGGDDYDYNSYGYWNSTFQYANNIKDTAKSILLTSLVSPFKNNTIGKGVFWNSKKQISGILFYILSPSGGAEVQHTFRSKKDEALGTIVRSNLAFSASVLLMKKERNAAGTTTTPAYSWPSLFEVKASYTARHELINTSDVKDSFIPLFKTDFIYYPLATENVSLTLSFSDGADPMAALEDQQFWALTVTIKK